MTNEEALETLKARYDDKSWIDILDHVQDTSVWQSAIEALEKQVSKRVLGRNGEFTKEDYKGTRYTYYACPNCKKAVKHHTEYCDKCGQHLLFPFVSHTPYIQGEKQEVILTWKDEIDD